MKQIKTSILARMVALLCVICMVCAGCGSKEGGDGQSEGQSADQEQSREGAQEDSVSAVTMSPVSKYDF